jgi:hypothetical protein
MLRLTEHVAWRAAQSKTTSRPVFDVIAFYPRNPNALLYTGLLIGHERAFTFAGSSKSRN